jgi:4-hydroxy-tetrahydrodipicolinate synthase
MASYRKAEARDWAKQHLRGVADVVIPSFSADLARLNEKGIYHDIRR